MKPIEKLKSGMFARGFALARVAVSAGTQTAAHALSTVLDNEEDKAQKLKDLLISQAGRLTTELGQLKGSVMKMGQLVSMYGEQFLPPEVNRILKQLQSQSPPMGWSAIETVLLQELGSERLALLEIEREPAASASLGQVHRARVRATGEQLALKVQYPGVADAIDSDLKTLRTVLSLTALLPKGPNYDLLFEEVRAMLHQETDYLQEAQWTQRFGEWLTRDTRYCVPHVVSQFSTGRVIATTWQDGVAADGPEVKALSQVRRDRLARLFLELYLRELFEFSTVQSDPHFGNYRVRLGSDPSGEQDQIVLLDFGAVRELPESYLTPYTEMTLGAYRQDRIAIIRAGQKLGFLTVDEESAIVDQFVDYCLLIGEPFHTRKTVQPEGAQFFDEQGRYDWGRSDLPTRVARATPKLVLSMRFRSPPRETVFNDRKIGGVFIFVASLGARLDSRAILDDALSQRDARNS